MLASAPAQATVVVRSTPQIGNRITLGLMFLMVLSSSVVFIEPAPYELLFLVFALAAGAFGLTIRKTALPLIFLMLMWCVGGAFSTMPVFNDSKAVTYLVVSAYLQLMTIVFACYFAVDTARRINIMRNAYIIAAVFTAALGIAAYFRLTPGTDLLLENGRVRATFKDPNIFGPFLILPLLFLIQSIIYIGVRLRYVILTAIIMIGVFLSFSRGAWGHFAFSAMLMIYLMVITTRSAHLRLRIVALTVLAGIVMSGLLAGLISMSAVGDLFTERANLAQSYDVGHGGRFGVQIASFEAILENPNGLGPEQFGKKFLQAPHNVYINAFVAYGWCGGFAYLALVLITLGSGLRALLVSTPWQPQFIAIYSTFAGVAAEGLIIDTDHWRHFFLLLGLVWGLIGATNRKRQYAVNQGLQPIRC